MCEGRAVNIHHRQRRNIGPEAAVNYLDLCGSGTTGCHGWIEHNRRVAYERGWLVHTWDDPAEVPWLPDDGDAVRSARG